MDCRWFPSTPQLGILPPSGKAYKNKADPNLSCRHVSQPFLHKTRSQKADSHTQILPSVALSFLVSCGWCSSQSLKQQSTYKNENTRTGVVQIRGAAGWCRSEVRSCVRYGFSGWPSARHLIYLVPQWPTWKMGIKNSLPHWSALKIKGTNGGWGSYTLPWGELDQCLAGETGLFKCFLYFVHAAPNPKMCKCVCPGKCRLARASGTSWKSVREQNLSEIENLRSNLQLLFQGRCVKTACRSWSLACIC